MTGGEASSEQPLNLHEYEAAARAALPPMVFDFVAGGAGDEATVRANRAAFARWSLLPRVLRGAGPATAATTVLGQPVALPVLVAPTSFHRLVHDGGEPETARAARRAGTIYTMGTVSTVAIEEVAPEAGTWWFQLYVYRDRGLTRELAARAEAAGAAALVVTIDMPAMGRREADERHRFALPPGLAMANFASPHQRGLADADTGSGLSDYARRAALETALTWADIEELAASTAMPIVPKGILHPADAVLAFDHGARAVIVSNHGGRQLDGAVASLDALPAVAEAVAGRGEVLLDGGIRRGTDVLKALALGARAVLIGRPVLWGLAAGGVAGVERVLALLRAEIELDLTLCGLASPEDVGHSLVVPADAPIDGRALR